MKILVDHGSYGNLGDISMVESVVSRLLTLLPRAGICVVDKSKFQSSILDLPNVSKTKKCMLRPLSSDIFKGKPFVWRFHSAWQKLSCKLTLQTMGTLIPAKFLPMRDGDGGYVPHDSLGRFCEEFDALHIAGGGNLTDIFLSELLNKCGFIHAFSDQGKPIILTGQQVGPFKFHSSKRALSKALKKVSFIGLREPTDSLRFCREAKIESQHYGVMGDDSMGLPSLNESLILGFLSEYGLKGKDFIALNIRIAPYAKEHANYIKPIASFTERIAKHFHKPVLIVPIALQAWDSDVTSGKRLIDEVHQRRVILMDKVNMTPAFVKGVLGKAFGAVGVSYHFCTFALSQGVPTVCIYDGNYYSQKARGLCDFWGDKRLALSLKGINTDLAMDHIAEVFNDNFLRKKLHDFPIQAIEDWKHIFNTQVKSVLDDKL